MNKEGICSDAAPVDLACSKHPACILDSASLEHVFGKLLYVVVKMEMAQTIFCTVVKLVLSSIGNFDALCIGSTRSMALLR